MTGPAVAALVLSETATGSGVGRSRYGHRGGQVAGPDRRARRENRPGLYRADHRRPGESWRGIVKVPCAVCGLPTGSAFGVCQRSPECSQEYRYRSGHAQRHRVCQVCGGPLRQASKWGICHRTAECRRAIDRLRRPPGPPGTCDVCGGPLRSDNKSGVCQRTAACDVERARRWAIAHPEMVKAGRRTPKARTAARVRARARRATNPEGARAYKRQWRAANAETERARNRVDRLRPDRPCRYKRTLGCTDYALPGRLACGPHMAAEDAARYRRNRERLRQRLATRQAGICTWCRRPLPKGLTGTHVDHVIPIARGGPDVDWNLQLLHGECNLAKADQLTEQAAELAARHGWPLHGLAVTP
jgi:5-methylcytosine-specific restriction endonuclease McrA